MPRGGKRPGAGRKSKAEEMGLVETIVKTGQKATGQDKPLEVLWEQIWREAISGSKEHVKFILEYGYGKPKQRIEADVTHDQMPAIIIRKPNDADL